MQKKILERRLLWGCRIKQLKTRGSNLEKILHSPSSPIKNRRWSSHQKMRVTNLEKNKKMMPAPRMEPSLRKITQWSRTSLEMRTKLFLHPFHEIIQPTNPSLAKPSWPNWWKRTSKTLNSWTTSSKKWSNTGPSRNPTRASFPSRG